MQPDAYSVHRFRRALLQFVGGRLAQAAARAVLVLALVRVLPIVDYGAYMLIVGTAEMLLQVASFGILPLAQRYLPQMLTTLPIRKLCTASSRSSSSRSSRSWRVIACALAYFWDALGPVFGMTQEQIERDALRAWLFLVVPAFRFSIELLEAMLAPGQAARALMVFARAPRPGADRWSCRESA